jgi:hypothetical protein
MHKLLLLILPLFILMSGCGEKMEDLTANLGDYIYFAVGQTVTIPAENLKIRFNKVAADSRCPQGATCIQAGEASILLEITLSGTKYEKTIIQPGQSVSNQADFQNYSFDYVLSPYPQQGKKIDQKDYRLQLMVERES